MMNGRSREESKPLLQQSQDEPSVIHKEQRHKVKHGKKHRSRSRSRDSRRAASQVVTASQVPTSDDESHHHHRQRYASDELCHDTIDLIDDAGMPERDTEHSLSNCDTIVHLLKGNVGTGILAMPDAIKNSGLLVGSVGLVIMSLICVSCMHVLVKCANVACERTNRPFMSYEDLAEVAFKTSDSPRVRKLARPAKMVISTFLCITQLGFCCVYFVFVAQNLKMVIDDSFGKLDYHVYMLIVLVPMLLLVSIRNLRYLSPIMTLANFLQFVGLGLIFFYLLQDLPKSWDRKAFASWGQLPLYFGTAIYAFEGIGVVLPIENQMRTPRALVGWNGVLNTSMVIVTCLYIAVGFFGYLKYGENVLGSITLNLPVDEWLAKIVIIMMSLAIFFSYAIQFYVPVTILLPFFKSRVSERYHLMTEYALRFALVLFTFALGAAIPRLDLFISLVGAVSSSTLALMAPPIIDTVTFWPDKGIYNLRIIRNVSYFMIGLIGFLAGSYVSVAEIVKYFASGEV